MGGAAGPAHLLPGLVSSSFILSGDVGSELFVTEHVKLQVRFFRSV